MGRLAFRKPLLQGVLKLLHEACAAAAVQALPGQLMQPVTPHLAAETLGLWHRDCCSQGAATLGL